MKLKDVLKDIRKTTSSKSLADSPFAKPQDMLDTGCYAINRIVSGSIHGGLPMGRITTLFGASQSGKSLLAAHTLIKAFKDNKIDCAFLFDSEGSSMIDLLKSEGVDIDKVTHIPVNSVEQCATKMLQTYDTLVKAHTEYLDDPDNNDDIRALCILDSYGALSADKLVSDAVNKDKTALDMGITAKQKNNMMRGLMMRVVQSNATLIVINHEYQDPSALFTSKIHLMGGGKGLEYASHVIVQCEKLLIKAADNDYLTGNEDNQDNTDVGFFKGNKMKFFVTKNRICKPCFSASAYVDFDGGIAKYDGLIDDCVKYGFIQEVRGGYIVPTYSDKRITYKELVSNDKIWDTFIEDFDKKSMEIMKYSNSNSRELDDIEKELNDGNKEKE